MHTTNGKKHWGYGGMASLAARIASRAPGYDRGSKSPTISYRKPLAATERSIVHKIIYEK